MNIIQIYKRFPTQESCIEHLEKVRWNGVPICPYCKFTKTTSMKKEQRHHCNTCNTSFSVTVDTIFHKTKCDLQKWFLAISLVLNAKKGISSRQLSRDIEVNKDTAWYMIMRIRKAFLEYGELLEGIIEMDETYFGGKSRGRNIKAPGHTKKRCRGTSKVSVVGMVQRGGNVSARVVKKSLCAKTMNSMIKEKVDFENSTLITDEFGGYSKVKQFMKHLTVNHQECYVTGDNREIHINTIEGFWGLLKRGIMGQYHKVSVHYLNRYIDEFCFRYNNKDNKGIFDLTVCKALGV